MERSKGLFILFAIAMSLLMHHIASAVEIDKVTGLIMDKGFEKVKANCTVCHSVKLVTQNRLDRKGWLEVIRWMQETKGLWQFDPETEKEILDYLSTHYGPTKAYRRPPLKVEWE